MQSHGLHCKSLLFLNSSSRNNFFLSSLSFAPKHKPVTSEDITLMKIFLSSNSKILVLTGAGISTESGIPDYRSEGVGLYAQSTSRPIQFQDFVKSPRLRKRYWARNYVGWPRFSSIVPNVTHFALRRLESEMRLSSIVTQNVDELHRKAGCKNVVELHGSAYRVICLHCRYEVHRHLFQETLNKLNPSISIVSQSVRPDGDVDLPQDFVEQFVVPNCPDCSGILKPDIVFFGDNVPRERVDFVKNLVNTSDALLVLGSSLFVFSGYRFILQAAELEKQIAIVNIGETRGDKHAHLKIDKKCGEIFSNLFENELT
ncbi:hypothetical protein R5R35_006262 [Gryllus longicercus]|uniref:NAD-dependent protein deacylase n=2 Tax=Gryllus longicercus TaxID=2509291 RepID=A0AAN9W757_9ORTH